MVVVAVVLTGLALGQRPTADDGFGFLCKLKAHEEVSEMFEMGHAAVMTNPFSGTLDYWKPHTNRWCRIFTFSHLSDEILGELRKRSSDDFPSHEMTVNLSNGRCGYFDYAHEELVFYDESPPAPNYTGKEDWTWVSPKPAATVGTGESSIKFIFPPPWLNGGRNLEYVVEESRSPLFPQESTCLARRAGSQKAATWAGVSYEPITLTVANDLFRDAKKGDSIYWRVGVRGSEKASQAQPDSAGFRYFDSPIHQFLRG